MKTRNSTIAILFVLLTSITSYGQTTNSLTLSQLISLTSYKTLSSFDTKARAMKYTFNSREVLNSSILYTYSKQFETSTRIFTFFLSYKDFGDGKPVITFHSGSNAAPGLLSDIITQARALGFVPVTSSCESTSDDTLMFCYESANYKLFIYDTRIVDDGYNYNLYRIAICHL